MQPQPPKSSILKKSPYLFPDLTVNTTLPSSMTTQFSRSKSRQTTRVSETPKLVFEVKRFLESPRPIKKKPFIIINEEDLYKKEDNNPYFYKPFLTKDYSKENQSFNEDFLQYIDGKLNISELINRNNFPHEFNKKETETPLVSGSKRISIRKKGSKSPKNNTNIRQAINNLKSVVQKKIERRRKENGGVNAKKSQFFGLFKYFANISDDYMKKIENSDLKNEDFTKKYYMHGISTEKNMGEFHMIKEKSKNASKLILYQKDKNFKQIGGDKSAEGVRRLKEENIFRERAERHKMKTEVDFFLSNLKKSREIEATMKKKVLHKVLQRSYMESQPRNSLIAPIKRRIFTDYDIELYEYLLHSKLINDFQNNKQNDIHLKELIDDDSNKILSRRKTTAGTFHSENSSLEKQPNYQRNLKTKEMIKVPHVIFAAVEKKRRGSISKGKSPVPKKEATKNEGNKECYSLYYNIRRNNIKLEENENNSLDGDESFVSNTEVTLDNLYNKSIAIQKKLVEKPEEHFSLRFKEIVKLDNLNNQIVKTAKAKLA